MEKQQMEALLIVGLVFATFLGLVLSKTLLSYGKSIDQYPAGGQETREISLWSPMRFTRISILAFWPLFIIGSFMVVLQSRFMLVGGIALITGLILYLGTAVVFSAAVFNAMASAGRGNTTSSPVQGVLRKMSPFSSRQGTSSRLRVEGKKSRPGYPGYRK
jgi:hypothetical protein